MATLFLLGKQAPEPGEPCAKGSWKRSPGSASQGKGPQRLTRPFQTLLSHFPAGGNISWRSYMRSSASARLLSIDFIPSHLHSRQSVKVSLGRILVPQARIARVLDLGYGVADRSKYQVQSGACRTLISPADKRSCDLLIMWRRACSSWRTVGFGYSTVAESGCRVVSRVCDRATRDRPLPPRARRIPLCGLATFQHRLCKAKRTAQ
jgi:hypothetical protein